MSKRKRCDVGTVRVPKVPQPASVTRADTGGEVTKQNDNKATMKNNDNKILKHSLLLRIHIYEVVKDS